ncbi:hypothetical protein P3T36_003241 [Kitasatospora sp. MAP12-15]|nr:hypothetical protein [Kitasatospora sp. MAP12-44]
MAQEQLQRPGRQLRRGQGGDCVEVADGFTGVLPVRDSKDPQGPALVFPAAAWHYFVAGIRAGEFPTDC